jgi:hypothetical protein
VSGPTDDVVRPRHVRLLDYELEVFATLAEDWRLR